MNGDKYCYKLYSLDNKDDWEYVYNNSDDIWLFHDLNLCNTYAKKKQAINISIIIYQNSQEPLAIIPLYRYKEKGIIPTTVIESFDMSGPALLRSLSEKKRRAIFNYFSQILLSIIKINKCDVLILSTPNLSKRNIDMHLSNCNPLHEIRGYTNQPIAYYYMDLSKPESQMLKELETRTRSIITKCMRDNHFDIRTASIDDLEEIYSLHCDTQKRTGTPIREKGELEFYLKYSSCSFYVARLKENDKLICAINIGEFANTAVYWLSYTATEYIYTEVGTFLLWHAIIESKKKGIVHFDIGNQAFLTIGSKGDNIAKFKRSFGGELRYKYKMYYERDLLIFMKLLKKQLRFFKKYIVKN